MDTDLRVALGDTIEEHPCASCRRTVRAGRGEVVKGDEVAALYRFDLHRRRRALRHKQLPVVWRVVDTLVTKDPAIADHWDPAPG